jgi:hypothetical protein
VVGIIGDATLFSASLGLGFVIWYICWVVDVKAGYASFDFAIVKVGVCGGGKLVRFWEKLFACL